MQAQGFIQDIGYDVNNFWEESNALATANDMDTNLAYMYKMVEKSQGNFRLDKKYLLIMEPKLNFSWCKNMVQTHSRLWSKT